jgi:hypothetical protein
MIIGVISAAVVAKSSAYEASADCAVTVEFGISSLLVNVASIFSAFIAFAGLGRDFVFAVVDLIITTIVIIAIVIKNMIVMIVQVFLVATGSEIRCRLCGFYGQ